MLIENSKQGCASVNKCIALILTKWTANSFLSYVNSAGFHSIRYGKEKT